MIEKILRLFFTKEYPHRNKKVTIIKNRIYHETSFDRSRVVPQNNKKTNRPEMTCLSKYFANNRGFNVRERLTD